VIRPAIRPLRFWSANSEPGGGVTPLPEDGASIEAASDPDQQDIIRFQDGDGEGFASLMERYRQRAYGLALGFCGNHDDAMDAVQKSFIRIHRSLTRFRVGEPFFPWFYRIVRNTSFNQKRDESRHQGDCPLEWVTEPTRLPSPLQAAEAEELKQRLWDAVEALAPELREVFLLYTFQGLKYREIAELLDIPLGTVMSRLHSARKRIRNHLSDEHLGDQQHQGDEEVPS
jgi:RNA polymerase sigma-70 factor (ECF subfamily)